MNILFCASLAAESASGRQRLWALQQTGAQVDVLAKDEFPSRWRRLAPVLAKARGSFRLSIDAGRLEEELLRRCAATQPDVVWIEWPREFSREALRELRRTAPHSTLLSFQDDNPWGRREEDAWQWKDYLSIVDQFDIHLIKRPSDEVHLLRAGARRTRMWRHGIYEPLFHPRPELAKVFPVTFVGTCMDERSTLVRCLLENGVDVHVFGNLWERRTDLPARFPGHFHGLVEGAAYAEVLARSHVSLGLVSRSNDDEWTMRTFEIAGCATALVAERTTSHQKLFVEGAEAEFFSGLDECVEKVTRLVANPAEAAQLGWEAHRKCHAAGWTLRQQARELLNDLRRA